MIASYSGGSHNLVRSLPNSSDIPSSERDIRKHAAVLGVSPGASADDVKSAWRRLAMVYHPDILHKSSSKDMAALNAAYSALRDGVPRTGSLTSSQALRSSIPYAQNITLSSNFRTFLHKESLPQGARKSLLQKSNFPGERWIARIFFRVPSRSFHVPEKISFSGLSMTFYYRGKPASRRQNMIVVPRVSFSETGRLMVSREIFHIVLDADTSPTRIYNIEGFQIGSQKDPILSFAVFF